jgi:hypothetical protein
MTQHRAWHSGRDLRDQHRCSDDLEVGGHQRSCALRRPRAVDYPPQRSCGRPRPYLVTDRRGGSRRVRGAGHLTRRLRRRRADDSPHQRDALTGGGEVDDLLTQTVTHARERRHPEARARRAHIHRAIRRRLRPDRVVTSPDRAGCEDTADCHLAENRCATRLGRQCQPDECREQCCSPLKPHLPSIAAKCQAVLECSYGRRLSGKCSGPGRRGSRVTVRGSS